MAARVLIANRGEIARRIARTCRRLGITTVAVHSDVDAAEPHVGEADIAVRVGPPDAESSYLDIAALIAAAHDTGCDAVHPGYGFLAEAPAFARAVAEAGLSFIGPSAEVIELMGDKAAAKRRMAEAGVPVVPGHDGSGDDDATLIAAAEQVGFPLLVKAVGGGGGKGMRAVHDRAELPDAIAAARREATAGFGDDRLLLERLVARPRHIEVQVLADRHGSVIHLLERECSVQRRHQKVVEEAPSPAVDERLRERLGAAAVTAASAIGYEGAGTVEFLVDGTTLDRDDPEVFFLEMNTRLQVEHPVTEAITGLDLVELQLRVADGGPLPLTQEAVAADGHALEVRLYAEDPVEQLPQTGPVVGLDWPHGPGVRVDAGIELGSEVTSHYDPMLAKLIVHAADRDGACQGMVAALADTSVRGVVTNLELLTAIVDHPVFRSGELSTAFLVEHLADWRPAEASPTALAVAARLLASHERPQTPPGDPTSPWSRLGPFRPGGVGGWPVRLVQPAADGHTVDVLVRERLGQPIIEVAGEPVHPPPHPAADAVRRGDGRTHVFVHADGRTVELVAVPSVRHADASAPSGTASYTSPLPGSVLALPIAVDEPVAAGTTLAVVEAMKMEHPIAAPTDGRITGLHVRVGDRVDTGTTLLDFEPHTADPPVNEVPA
ncbi:MAG: acetyl/propionyl/methylcrotonyl-CoA carboxylase subunit alpha [Nitriliruptoraceae bacterium]